MLDREWEYYENNREELVEKYCGKRKYSNFHHLPMPKRKHFAFKQDNPFLAIRLLTEAHVFNIAKISIGLPNMVMVDEVNVMICNLNQGFDLIIGMDIILLGDFSISNGNGKTLFSFALPLHFLVQHRGHNHCFLLIVYTGCISAASL